MCIRDRDHFQGNRTPYTDPRSRGAIHGLSLKHSRAHIFRASIEGIAFGSELIFESMRENGFHPEKVVISGGATRSKLWLQIHADVSNVPITLTKNPDAPLLGCAILSAVGAGFYQDVPTAVDTMVQTETIVEPNDQHHKAYKPFFESYKKTYSTIRNIRNNLED